MSAILTAIFIILASFVSAQEDDPYGITLYGSFLHTADVPNALFFFNDIEEYDSFELRRALRNHEIEIVVLGSDGGSVLEGLNMAGIIYDRGITTYVPKLPKDMGCYSACAYMYFGGKTRQADGVLAVHQTGYYGSEADKSQRKVSEVQQNTQFTVSEIIGFLNEFETPPWVYEKMFRSRDFYEFSKEEKARLASRENEIDPQNLYAINAFINSFFKYLDSLDTEEKNRNTETVGELSDEELKLVILEIQKLLNAAGCNAGVEDGIWGRRTQAAAILFAKTAKLPTSEENLISDKFLETLESAPNNFCPKPKRPKKEFFAQYSYSCQNGGYLGTLTSLGKSGALMRMQLALVKTNGRMDIYLSKINMKTARFTMGSAINATMRAFLQRDANGKISMIQFKFGSNSCFARAK